MQIPVPLAVVAIVLLAGCGSGSAAKARFVAEADTLCRQAAAAAPKAPAAAGTAEPPLALHPFFDKTADNLDGLVTALGALEPPKGIRPAVEAYVQNLSYIALFAHRATESSSVDAVGRTSRFVRAMVLLSAMNVPLVGKIGFRACSREGPPKAASSRFAALKVSGGP
jgi:hypothetical protein